MFSSGSIKEDDEQATSRNMVGTEKIILVCNLISEAKMYRVPPINVIYQDVHLCHHLGLSP